MNLKKLIGLSLMLTALPALSLTIERNNFRIVTPPGSPEPVILAANSLARDFGKVMRWVPDVDSSVSNDGKSINIIALDKSHCADTTLFTLKPLDNFESHRIYTDETNRNIYLLGEDMRGAIYAIYDFSEEFLGVPPLWYFCDWKPEYVQSIEVAPDFDKFVESPDVRFRAWFPNDEDLVNPWREKSWQNDELWLEAMLRLKLNTVEYGPTVTYPDHKMSHNADLLKKYGLVLTSHHMVGLNNSFANWEKYWETVRGMKAPELLLSNIDAIKEFWTYNIETIMQNDQENLWQIAFRGRRDEPFWSVFADAPKTDEERGEVINKMVGIQYDMIKKATGDPNPFVRMTFYDELSDLLAKGYLVPPAASNMLWTFVAGRRDHYPYDDLVNYDFSKPMQLGYYMNLQFTSTGAHLAPAESPWKMEQNYRYVVSRGPLTFSVVNAGNIREFVMEMSANAKMMWDLDNYDTDKFLKEYCIQYYGEELADEIADLYRDYYKAYWLQRPSEFPGMDRQFIFQDLRHAQVFNQIIPQFDTFKRNPLFDIGFERVKGRSFRLVTNNQVDEIIGGMELSGPKFHDVADRCDDMMKRLPVDRQNFFYDNLSGYAHYMAALSGSVCHFLKAYKSDGERKMHLIESHRELKNAQKALHSSQHGVFDTWYATDRLFDLGSKIASLELLIKKME